MKILILGAATSKGLKTIDKNNEAYSAWWVENLISGLKTKDIDINFMFVTGLAKNVSFVENDGICYISIPECSGSLEKKVNDFTNIFKDVVEKVKPDVVHIIGTEREYNYALLKAFNNPDKTIVSITGMVTYYSQHYLGGIDRSILKKKSLGDFIKRWGPLDEQRDFIKCAIYEKKLLEEAKYVFGRTSWDNTCSLLINPSLNYIHCGEIINPIYQTEHWDYKNCQKHSIFISQATYPIKGFHQLIEALPYILKKYPDTVINVAGFNLFDESSFMAKVKRNTYSKYLLGRMKKLGINKETISFKGYLKPQDMLKQYLNANVFVLPSIIENSPNSLGEAMMVGVPCVASYVGGVGDMVENGKDGFTYPFNEPYKLAKYILNIFDNIDLANSLSLEAQQKARVFFNTNEVIETSFKTYERLGK